VACHRFSSGNLFPPSSDFTRVTASRHLSKRQQRLPHSKVNGISMFELTVESDFSASHILEGYDGPCGRLHGHNYRVRVSIEGEKQDALGMVLDLRILKKALAEAIEPLDHRHLNDLPPFANVPPSAENLARHIFQKVREALAELEVRDARLRQVAVAESNQAWVTYRP